MQCRERWVHHLSPVVNKAEWTAEEDGIIFEQVGASWLAALVRSPSGQARPPASTFMNVRAFLVLQLMCVGKSWVSIAGMLPGRTPQQVKNRYYAACRRIARAKVRSKRAAKAGAAAAAATATATTLASSSSVASHAKLLEAAAQD
ncbi:hypothetical protein EON66_12355 [archaeon]|nr:MAG: hypothetical protein EON66_12355 [archaeon]